MLKCSVVSHPDMKAGWQVAHPAAFPVPFPFLQIRTWQTAAGEAAGLRGPQGGPRVE